MRSVLHASWAQSGAEEKTGSITLGSNKMSRGVSGMFHAVHALRQTLHNALSSVVWYLLTPDRTSHVTVAA